MRNSNPWSVDRLAASRLLTDLNLAVTDEQLDMVARHLAVYRRDLMTWAAEQAHGQVIRKLEATPRSSFGRESDEWNRGFSFAEQRVMTMTNDELLERDPAPGRTRGQILRTMMRHARAAK